MKKLRKWESSSLQLYFSFESLGQANGEALTFKTLDEVSLTEIIYDMEYKRGLPADNAFLKAAQQELSRRKVGDSQLLNDL